MRIALSGSTGFIGRRFHECAKERGHEVVPLIRSRAEPKRSVAPDQPAISWDPERGTLEARDLENFDAIVHLGGENLASRWNAEIKERILRSRVDSTGLLARTISTLARPPRVFVSASAIGFYGDRGVEELDEQSSAGRGFLPTVCIEWEKAAQITLDRSVRIVHPRFGIVLDGSGGALKRMLLPFSLGLGGRLGNGHQQMSWITLRDAVSVLLFLLDGTLSGPVNVVSPNPVSNRELTSTLAKVLHRPAVFPVPAPLLRLIVGGLADEGLLASQRVFPRKLIAAGFRFEDPQLEAGLRNALAGPGLPLTDRRGITR